MEGEIGPKKQNKEKLHNIHSFEVNIEHLPRKTIDRTTKQFSINFKG